MNEKKLKVSNYLLPCLVTYYLVPQTSNRIFQSIFFHNSFYITQYSMVLLTVLFDFLYGCVSVTNTFYVYALPVIVLLSSHQPHMYRGEAIYQISIHILCITCFTHIYIYIYVDTHTHTHFMECSMDFFWFQDTLISFDNLISPSFWPSSERVYGCYCFTHFSYALTKCSWFLYISTIYRVSGDFISIF
jgi:hypothetical protein